MFSSVFDDTSTSDSKSEVWSPNATSILREIRSIPCSSLEYVINHIFFAVYRPGQPDYTAENAHALASAVLVAARAYDQHIHYTHKPQWLHITKMLEHLQVISKHIRGSHHTWEGGTLEKHEQLYRDHVTSQLGGMETGDILVIPAQLYVGGVTFRMQEKVTLCEVFQLPGSGWLCSVLSPSLAAEVPNQVLRDAGFLSRLADSLSGKMRISLYDVLRDAGKTVDPHSITKRLTSDRLSPFPEWSRSDLWLLIRVSIHSSFDRSHPGHDAYKVFMLFFMCNLARYAIDTSPPGILIHSMLAKILRRAKKLGSSIPQWLSEAVLHTCTILSRTLDQRRQEVLDSRGSSTPWNPSQLDLAKDAQHSLPRLRDYVSTSVMDHRLHWHLSHTPFVPTSPLRGTLIDFVSRTDEFLQDDIRAVRCDVLGTFFDVERAVGDDIDEWVAYTADVDEACEQLSHLMYKYSWFPEDAFHRRDDMHDFDHHSIVFLTIIELWIALDKLVVREFPILADYSPEVDLDLFRLLLLRDEMHIHRLCRAHQYLFARHQRAHKGWSVFSSEFTEDSFPCRYYDRSPHLQHLRAHIQYALPSELLRAKVVVFELQCPVSLDRWRSATYGIFLHASAVDTKTGEQDIRVCDIPVLQPHILNPLRSLSLYTSPASQPWALLYYSFQRHARSAITFVNEREYQLPGLRWLRAGEDLKLERYRSNTEHTSNEVLASQTDCPPNLSLDKFLAFAHLRSGGSLQWFNIVRELRSRSLDVRQKEVYLLLAQASAQVGPHDSTGELSWHQEIQDSLFCYTLLDELQSLFTDVGAGSLHGPAMASISLLAGVLASRSSTDVSERALQLLQGLRRKTFDWVQELMYNARTSPTSKESLELLRDMAAICRSTFDVGSTFAPKLLRTAQNIQVALSCAMIIYTVLQDLPAPSGDTYSEILINRDRRLSFFLEKSLGSAIQDDASAIGVDRAVQLVWPGYRPSPHRWESLQPPNSRWLVCESAPTQDTPPYIVHINLLDGTLMVDGKLILNKLPIEVTRDSTYQELFGDDDLTVVVSDLPGSDYATMSALHDHYVHFTVRRGSYGWIEGIVIRAQKKDTDDLLELIPREKMFEDFPASLVMDHVHWLNLSTSVIEIRPIKEPWKQSPDNWTIHIQPGQSWRSITNAGRFLVDIRSPTWEMISGRLRCLENRKNLIVTVNASTTLSPSSLQSPPQISAILPRYGLSFFVNELGQLESHDFKDMVYDEDQCIGTLFGLVDRLILRPKTQFEAELIPKRIITPVHPVPQDDASVRYASEQAHYHTYQADSELGCLKGDLSLLSKLHLARLHAFTGSGCRPDHLTGRTGVEEAISLIWLAGTREGLPWSFQFSPTSPQMYLALAKLKGAIDRFEPGQPSDDYVLQDACLFPSEVATSVQPSSKGPLATLDQLFHERPPPNTRERNGLPHYNPAYHGLSHPPNTDPLRQLFSSLRTREAAPSFHSQYISQLHDSVHQLQIKNPGGVAYGSNSLNEKPSLERLRKHYVECRNSYTESLDMVKLALGPKTEFERLLDQCGQWPRITPFTLFRCLASTTPIKPSESWKQCLISLALLALDIQKARRLFRFALDNSEEEFNKEWENEGCDGWDAAEYPDWLLIQLQGDFLIRRVQADIAKEIMSPRSGTNTVMQVNMGEGKTSVIIPICAAALADSNRLVRIIVPKSLIPQTLQILQDRLGGLVNKPIYHLTFSRDYTNDRYDPETFKRIKRLYKLVHECREDCGILVMQPEHVLSFRLSSVEILLLENRFWTTEKSIPMLHQPELTPEDGTTIESNQVVPNRGFKRVIEVFRKSLIKPIAKSARIASFVGKLKRLHRKTETLEEHTENESIAAPEGPEPIEHEETEIESHMLPQVSQIQRFFEVHARDILDESDEILRPQSQVIYTLGQEYPFEGSPDRWLIVQQVLQLVKRHAILLSTADSCTIHCDSSSPGAFPHIRILQPETGTELISLITQDVLRGRLSTLRFHSDLGFLGSIRDFILHKDIHRDTAKLVEEYAHQTTNWSSLLLLRGLFAHDILLFALTQRRWRVDYGLDDPSSSSRSAPRTTLAIPYRAKDVPSETAEFGHPDITILLTCLSYYYTGLKEEQLRTSFELMLQEDDPSSEYDHWLEDYGTVSLPNSLRKLSGVNVRSLEQWNTYFFPLFTRNQRAIDLYLSKIVFPKYAKEFPQKISGSYWDLAERKDHLVTGFSGTNDGQYLLPTSITQDDPDYLQQAGTNARVLAYLLQPENASYIVTSDQDGERWTTVELLSTIAAQKPEIRVLLDVGAQILDMSNIALAEAWLDCTPSAEIAGAIYFDEHDRLMVLTRNGTTNILSSSPLAQQLHRCVTYLDDAHTRGTDLKFPVGFRAAVTLGHKLTKDRLVQGCMRMRRLGHGQSVMFFAPHEVDQRIRNLVAKENPNIPVTTADILRWTIHETWSDIQRRAPYWAQEGMNHQSRCESWSRFCHKKATGKELQDSWVQPEKKSLAEMYMPPRDSNMTSHTTLPRQIRERCESMGILSLREVHMDEEQEREVSREIERERQVMKRLPIVSPAPHYLHPHLIEFVTTGVLQPPSQSEAFRHVFATDVTASSGPHAWNPNILATADFCETVMENEPAEWKVDHYLRPVQWVLSGKMRSEDVLVILSPFEVDQLMPQIRISKHVHLHVYVPRTTEHMKPADDLRLYTVPPLPSNWTPPWALIDQLNIFAGQLYLSHYASYVRLCRFLGIHTGDQPTSSGTAAARNWLRNPESVDEEIKNRFEGTPLLRAMQMLVARRRTPADFAGTHMGRILDGWSLTEGDFQSYPL